MTPARKFQCHSRVFHAFTASCLLLTVIGCGSSTTSGGSGGGTPPPTNAKQWTWVSGSDQAGSSSTVSGSYGSKGIASATNIPPGRDGAVSWMDPSGNLWLFGGGGVDPLGTKGSFNDLWKYDRSSKQWAWMSGSSSAPGNQIGVYGTQGMPDSANVPGGRATSVSWTDASGHLWMFGGSGFDSTGQDYLLNDLWEFNPSTTEWTWINGSDIINGKAVYGTLGVAAASNIPGARERAVSWTDQSGNFWLFGGDGYDPSGSGSIGSFNDLWEFSPSTKEWTWVSGETALNAKGVYGALGTSAAGNVPGGRVNAVSWADSKGNLWLFGGLGYDATGTEYDLNDLWEFNPSSKQWTWVSGTGTVNVAGGNLCVAGVYGTEGTAAAANVPGGRNAAAGWTDASGNLWLFGGLGCDSSGTAGALNDLWEFDASSKTWTWQSGSNSVGPPQGGTGGQSGAYGTQGTASSANTPGGRSGPLPWIDSNGNLWLFGGSGHDSTGAFGVLNDLWRYTP